jgi:hypothetical protein
MYSGARPAGAFLAKGKEFELKPFPAEFESSFTGTAIGFG